MTTVFRNFAATIVVLIGTALHPTLLELRFVDPDGNEVQLDKAELLLVGWGEVGRIQLEPTEEGLQINLDPNWLRPRMGNRYEKFDWLDHLDYVFVYLQADPFASIRSNAFQWIGDRVNHPGPVRVAFPGGETVIVEKGETIRATITFRKKDVKHVRFVDPEGRPFPGIHVDAYMYWSAQNHCGALSGSEPLGEFVSDAYGLITLPDGDYEYALELRDRRIREFVPYSNLSWRVVSDLKTPEPVFVVLEHPIRPLELIVRREGKPVTGWVQPHVLTRNCSCGACSALYEGVDKFGRIRIKNFRPAIYSSIWLMDHRTGEELWRADPSSWTEPRTIEIDLPSHGSPKEETEARTSE